MIDAQYCQLMARYNAWQNDQLLGVLDEMSDEQIRHNRGAFFGSIFETLNHLLWGDTMWLSRFGFCPPADVPGSESVRYCPDYPAYKSVRLAMDQQILDWSLAVSDQQIKGMLEWHSVMSGTNLQAPMWECIVHLFNHQTHHRGQVHAMLTQTGVKGPVTDIPFLPK